MDKQSDDTLFSILEFVPNLQLMKLCMVNKKWHHVITTRVFKKEEIPTMEECIITSDYYHFARYMGIKFDQLTQELMLFTKDKVFKQFCDNETKYNSIELLQKYSGKGHIKVVKYLLDKGVPIKNDYDSPLISCSLNGQLNIMKFLIKQGAKVERIGGCLLRYSSEKGFLDMAEYILSLGVSVNASDDLALRWCAQDGPFESVKFLVEKGADINSCHTYPLRTSAPMGRYDVAKYLIENGANVGVLNNCIIKDTLLNGHFRIAKLLWNHGATMSYKEWIDNGLGGFLMSMFNMIVNNKFNSICICASFIAYKYFFS
jgi:hypothetical protein